MIAWAFATKSCVHEPLMAALSSSSMPTLSQFAPVDLATTAWSFAVLRFCNEPLFTSIAWQARARLQHCEWKPQGLANTVWAFATLQ